MNAKKLALELLIKINNGDTTIEELNEHLAETKKQMEEIGDDGSQDFKALSQVVEDAESSIASMNGELKKTKEGFEDTTKAQKDATKGTGIFAKGLKVVGGAFKALGIGLIVGAIKLFYDAISKNQRVMDALSTALGTIGILFEKAFNVIFDTVEAVYKASDGFSGLGKVMKGLITISLTPVQLAFQSIKLVIQSAQLAWEKSFFGGGDEGKIKELTADVNATSDAIKEIGVDALNAGKDVVNNFGAAVGEISSVVGGAVEGIQEISVKGAIEQAKAITEATNASQIAAANQASLVEKYDRLAEKQRQIRDDERNSIQDRIKANNKLGEVLDKQEKAMLAQANEQIKQAKLDFAANKRTENEVALIEALANKKAILAQVEGFRSEQKANDLALDRERMQMNSQLSESESSLAMERKRFDAEQIEDKLLSLQTLRALEEENQQEEMLRLEGIVEMAQARTQAEVDALIALDEFREASRQQNATRDKEIDEEKTKRLLDEQKKKFESLQSESEIDEQNFNARRADLRRRQALLLEDETLTKEQRLELEKQFAAESKKIDEDAKEAKIALAHSTVDVIGNLSNLLAQGNEKQQKAAFKLNKAASIGQAIINTSVGVSKAFAQGGVGGFVTGASVALAGAAQIATIAKTQFNAGGSTVTTPSQNAPTLGGGDVGRVPRGLDTPTVNTGVQTTKVIVTETDIRDVSRNMDGVYSRATVVQ